MEAIVLAVLLNIALVLSAKLPDYIHICHRSDPDINGCIEKSIEFLRPNLKSGMPELNVPSIEPLHIEELVASEGNGIRITTKDLEIFGGSNFTIHSIDVVVDTGKIDFKVSFDHLHVAGKYDVDGKIMMIPIKGTGDVDADAYDVKGAFGLLTEFVKKDDGEEYLKFTGMDMDFTVAKGKIYLDNLFGGDKLIGEVVNNAINANFQFFMKELTPSIKGAIRDFIITSANKIFDVLPYNEIFPQ